MHELKTWPGPFEAVVTGLKRFEVRRNDREYCVGDILWLREWDPETERYSGREAPLMRIAYILPGGCFGVEEGFCVLGMEPADSLQTELAPPESACNGSEQSQGADAPDRSAEATRGTDEVVGGPRMFAAEQIAAFAELRIFRKDRPRTPSDPVFEFPILGAGAAQHSSPRPVPVYRQLRDWLQMVRGSQGKGVRELYRELWDIFVGAPGSQRLNQAWRGIGGSLGGYLGRTTDCLNIGVDLYKALGAFRPFPFELSDLVLVLAVRDVDRPARYIAGDAVVSGATSDRSHIRALVLDEFGITLTPEQESAIQLSGGGVVSSAGDERVALAELVAAVDLLAARF